MSGDRLIGQMIDILEHLMQRLFAEKEVLSTVLQPVFGLLAITFLVVTAARLIRVPARPGHRLLAMLAFILAVGLLPVALYAVFLLSSIGLEYGGRMLQPLAYLLAFLAAGLYADLKGRRLLRWGIGLLVVLLCYRFVLFDARTCQRAFLRTVHELNFANRRQLRLE